MHGLGGVFAAIGLAAFGVIASAASVIATTAGDTGLGPWVSGGGAAAAVGGLVYVAKKLAAGDLVAFPVSEIVKHQQEREMKLEGMLEDSLRREDSYHRLLTRNQR